MLRAAEILHHRRCNSCFFLARYVSECVCMYRIYLNVHILYVFVCPTQHPKQRSRESREPLLIGVDSIWAASSD